MLTRVTGLLSGRGVLVCLGRKGNGTQAVVSGEFQNKSFAHHLREKNSEGNRLRLLF